VRNEEELFRAYILKEAEKIKKEISTINFKEEYGLTKERWVEIMQRIYNNIMKQRQESDDKM